MMQASWNKLSLERPPTTSWQCVAKEFDYKGFLKTINRAILELESHALLNTEAAVLSRLIYRMKSKLRSDKGFKNMEKANRALLNYLKLSLEKEYKYLRDNSESNGNIHALPSRQMLQYTLSRTQGFAKLMCRIENVARIAADFFKARISLGQAWNLSVVAYAVVSRIWILARHLTKQCCEWYNRMYKYMSKLKTLGVPWISENYSFPEDLKTWLSVSWINDDIKNIPAKETLSESIFNLIKSHDDAEEDREIDVEQMKNTSSLAESPISSSVGVDKPIIKSDFAKIASDNNISSASVSLDELGERISREAFVADRSNGTEKQFKKRQNMEMNNENDVEEINPKRTAKIIKKKVKSEAMSVDKIETKEDIVKFISSKSYPGLDKLQWKILRKNVSKLLLKLDKYDSSNTKKHDLLLKKVIQSIREWIN